MSNIVSIYDAPSMLIDMAWNDELTLRGARSAFFAQDMLSPQERLTFTDRLKDRIAGDNSYMRAMVGIATNPIVLLASLAAPASSTALKGSRAIFAVSDAAKPWNRSKLGAFGFLQGMGFYDPKTVMRGTGTEGVLDSTLGSAERVLYDQTTLIEEPMQALLAREGIKPGTQFDPRNPLLNAAQQQRAERYEALSTIYLNGWDKNRTVKTLGSKGNIRTTEVEADFYIDSLEEIRREFGEEGVAVVTGIRQSMDRSLVNLVAKDELIGDLRDRTGDALMKITSRDQIDPEKLIRITSGLNDKRLLDKEINAGGLDEVGAAFGSDFGEASVDTFFELITDQHYFPRNISHAVDSSGRTVSIEGKISDAFRRTVEGSQGRATARSRVKEHLHPDDMESLVSVVGLDRTRQGYLSDIDKMKEWVSSNSDGFIRRNRLAQSVSKYNRQTASLQHLFSNTLSEETQALIKENGGDIYKEVNGRRIMKSNADAILDDYDRITTNNGDKYAARTLTHWLLPTLAGRYEAHNGLRFLSEMGVKQKVNQILGTGPLGDLIENAGIKNFRSAAAQLGEPGRGLDQEASRLLQMQDGGDQFLAKWLYSSHLGLNMSSVLLNLTQPFLMGGSILGTGNILKGYARSIKEMGSYMAERVSMGPRVMHHHEKVELLKKHFKHFDAADLRPDAFEAVDTLAFRASRANTPMEKFLSTTLMPFQAAETINRSTIAHATESMYLARGMNPNSSQFMRDASSLIQQTQFAPSRVNTPLAFQAAPETGVGGPLSGLLNNPLMRMFVSFPLRSFTATFGALPSQIGAGRRTFAGMEVAMPRTIDFLRAMGVSAAVYEVGKEVLDADLSRGLAYEAATDIVNVADPRFTGPVPPVIDIGVEGLGGLLQGDMEAVGRSITRLVPGGIAASKLTVLLPDEFVPDLLQKEHVRYDLDDGQGNVPVYDKSGQLLRTVNKYQLIGERLGVDIGRFFTDGDTNAGQKRYENYILSISREIREYKGRASAALAEGDTGKYERIRGEFEKRFNLPLTFDQNEVRRRSDHLAKPRLERMLSRIEESQRPAFQQDDATEAIINQLNAGGETLFR